MERKLLKAERGVELSEDKEGRVYLTIDGYDIFNGGLPKNVLLKQLADKSYKNLVEIRRKQG